MNMAPPPVYPAAELERVVSPIALYPDPLLAQVLAAATFWADIPDAARWADQHHYMVDAQLTAAMQADHLPWDPAVQALLPFPSVLSMMASSMPWTQELGAAFLAQEGDVMDAVQRQRQRAHEYGYLQSTPRYTVSSGPYISIVPVNPAYIVVRTTTRPSYAPRFAAYGRRDRLRFGVRMARHSRRGLGRHARCGKRARSSSTMRRGSAQANRTTCIFYAQSALRRRGAAGRAASCC